MWLPWNVNETLGVASNGVSRVAAHSPAWRVLAIWLPLDGETFMWLIPALLVAGASGYTAASRSRGLMFLIPLLALPPYAFFAYHGAYDSAQALATHAFTGAALSSGLCWFASICCALAAIPMAFLVRSSVPDARPRRRATRS